MERNIYCYTVTDANKVLLIEGIETTDEQGNVSDNLPPRTKAREGYFTVYELPPEVQQLIDDALKPSTEEVRNTLKAERQALVDSLEVTISSGKTFNGDETSQNRMSRAITALNGFGRTTTEWVLADNSFVEVTVQELTEALALAGIEQTKLWNI
jgi:hypothetical protein